MVMEQLPSLCVCLCVCMRVYVRVFFAEIQDSAERTWLSCISISYFRIYPEMHFKYFVRGDAEKHSFHMSSADIVLLIYEQTCWF